MPHVVFGFVLLMLVGYLLVELARYHKAQTSDRPAYPARRLLLRTVNGLLLLFLLGVLLYAPTPLGRDPITRFGLPLAFIILPILVYRDIAGVRRQYKQEAKAREQQFLHELERTVRKKRRK